MIRHLKHNEIDKIQWDACIDKSVNRLVYAKSWFLDIVSPQWEALIVSDYLMVMPLPVKRKLFIKYIVQPVYTQQLGVFSSKQLSAKEVLDFLNHIPGKFVRQVINLNSFNNQEHTAGITDRVNFELSLNKSFAALYQEFNDNTKRNIRKAISEEVLMELSNDIRLFTSLYKTTTKEKPNRFELEKLQTIMTYAIDNQKGDLVFVRNRNGEIISGAFFLTAMDRIIYVASFTNAEGQEVSAMFLVMSEMIKKYAATEAIFDFEGSMISGVARFFAGFGAERKIYQQFRRGW